MCGSIGGCIWHNFNSIPESFFTLSFDISPTNEYGNLWLRSKCAPWNSLSGRHKVFKFSSSAIGKNQVKSLLSWSYQLFFLHQLQNRIFCLLTSSPKRVKLATSGCAHLKELEILFPTVIYFLIFPFANLMKSTMYNWKLFFNSRSSIFS